MSHRAAPGPSSAATFVVLVVPPRGGLVALNRSVVAPRRPRARRWSARLRVGRERRVTAQLDDFRGRHSAGPCPSAAGRSIRPSPWLRPPSGARAPDEPPRHLVGGNSFGGPPDQAGLGSVLTGCVAGFSPIRRRGPSQLRPRPRVLGVRRVALGLLDLSGLHQRLAVDSLASLSSRALSCRVLLPEVFDLLTLYLFYRGPRVVSFAR